MTPMTDWSQMERDAWLYRHVSASGAAVIAVDGHGVVTDWGAGAEVLFGWPAADAVGRRLTELHLVADPVRQRRATDIARRVMSGESWSGDWTARRRDGSPIAVSTVQEPLRDQTGEVVGAVSVTLDLSARDRFEAALLREAMHDPLTGLPNRALLRDQLGRLVDEHRRRPGSAAVLFVDLDRFKEVNDERGHAVGDAVLREVARRLSGAVREGDVVGRLGGDEFVVLCRFGASIAGVMDIAERIAAAMVRPVVVNGEPVEVSASVGVAIATVGTNAEALLDRADAAMYRAKSRQPGRSGVVVLAEQDGVDEIWLPR